MNTFSDSVDMLHHICSDILNLSINFDISKQEPVRGKFRVFSNEENGHLGEDTSRGFVLVLATLPGSGSGQPLNLPLRNPVPSPQGFRLRHHEEELDPLLLSCLSSPCHFRPVPKVQRTAGSGHCSNKHLVLATTSS